MSKITLAELVFNHACRQQTNLFMKLFGDSVEVNMDLVEHAELFDWGWAARHFLPPEAKDEFLDMSAHALREYGAAATPFSDKYVRDCRLAEKLPGAPYCEDFKIAIRKAWDEKQAACAPLWSKYERVRASTFLRLYMEHNP